MGCGRYGLKAVFGNWHDPCDVLLVQYIASTSPAVTKAYGYSQYAGATTCEEMWITQWVEIFGSIYVYDNVSYRMGRTTYYVWTPNSSGAYGNPSTAYHQFRCYPCSALIAVTTSGSIYSYYKVEHW